MALEVGKHVVAESESIDRRPRSGVVEEVIRGDPAPRYRIRWDDGHEAIYTPASGALRASDPQKRRRGSANRSLRSDDSPRRAPVRRHLRANTTLAVFLGRQATPRNVPV